MNAPQSPADNDDMAAGLSEEVKARYRNLPRPPKFDTPAQERLHRVPGQRVFLADDLAEALNRFGRQ